MSPEQKVKIPATELRPITADSVTEYLSAHWDKSVSFSIAGHGYKEVVPKGWHGEGKQGDALVLFGDVLTTPISGTNLPSPEFCEWLGKNGFELSNGQHSIGVREASDKLASSRYSMSEVPVFRATRSVRSGRVPVLIEFWQGSKSAFMQALTHIGNSSKVTPTDAEAYRGVVALLMPFISKGTTTAKQVLGIPQDAHKIRRLDDCLASMVTMAGDMLVEDAIHANRTNVFDEIGVSVATTQAVVIATWLAEKRGVPLILRAGAPSFGLGTKETGLNYMMNTQPEMLQYGNFTSGDFGTIMADGSEKDIIPHKKIQGNGYLTHETRVFLNGGGPILNIMKKAYEEHLKPHHGIISVRRASRIDNGPKQWGVIIDGIHSL